MVKSDEDLEGNILGIIPQLEASVVDVQGQVLVVQVFLQLHLAVY